VDRRVVRLHEHERGDERLECRERDELFAHHRVPAIEHAPEEGVRLLMRALLFLANGVAVGPVLVLAKPGVEPAPRDDWQIAGRHAFAQARDEVTVPSDNHVRSAFREGEGDTGSVAAEIRQHERDRVMVPIETQRKFDVIGACSIEAREKVRVVPHNCSPRRGMLLEIALHSFF
jgi:hypothetical protein